MKTKISTYSNIDEIISGCKDKNRLAQQALYNMFASKMATLCMRYVGDRYIAMDVMHDGFIHLFEVIDKYESLGSFEGWLRRVFVNQALQYLRTNDLLRHSDDIEDVGAVMMSDAADALDEISASEIMSVITKLPPLNRSVFNLYALEGYSHRDIANQLDMNEATVRSLYLRTRLLLQKQLIDYRR